MRDEALLCLLLLLVLKLRFYRCTVLLHHILLLILQVHLPRVIGKQCILQLVSQATRVSHYGLMVRNFLVW